MSIDRRMVSILLQNNIEVNKVEKFIGINKENYYEIMINGKVEKLKIPGVDYSKYEKEISTVEHLENQVKQLDKNIEKLESFTNIEDVVEHIKKDQLKTPKEEAISFEEELEKTEKENQEILEVLKKDTKPKTKRSKKIIKTKNTDDEVDDFLDTI
jgi:hypothetical protein